MNINWISRILRSEYVKRAIYSCLHTIHEIWKYWRIWNPNIARILLGWYSSAKYSTIFIIFSRKRATANMATSQQPAAHIQNHIQNYIRIFDDFSHIQNIRPGPVPAKLHKFGKKTTLYPNSRAFVNIRAYLAYPRHIRTIFKPCVFANVCAYPRHI